MEYNKAKVEKGAKSKETDIVSMSITDNRSVIRAIARWQASKELYPEATDEVISGALHVYFYSEAKWQPAWEEPFAKAVEKNLIPAEFHMLLREKLGAPAARGRRKSTVQQPAEQPANADPEAILTPDPNPTPATAP